LQIIRYFCKNYKYEKKKKILIKLAKTKKFLYLNPFCVTTIGMIIKTKFKRNSFNKAGYSRKMGWLPSTRGYAMNPVDHPHGGRTKAGLQVSMWGQHTKGKKNKKNHLSYYEVKMKR